MPDREKVIKGLDHCDFGVSDTCYEDDCPYYQSHDCTYELKNDILVLLKEQEPRALTLEEVVKHYSLPPIVPNDLEWQADYLQDIAPLYFEFPEDDSWIVHWRGYYHVQEGLEHWGKTYGRDCRCWTAKPTEEQRRAAKWE